MKRIYRGIGTVFMAATIMTSSLTGGLTVEAADKGAVILYTNDAHCSIEGYSYLAAYRAELLEEGYEVLLVDAGDHVQGEVIGALSEGSSIINLMNEVGYDYAVPGNHEFDYGMETFLNFAVNEAEFKYLCANFVDLTTNETVLDTYDIVEMNGESVAIIGLSTPESYTKSTPTYFQDDEGNFIYSFSEDSFYETVQNTVDAAVAEGADRVVVVGHLGIDGTTDGWKSTDVIANTTGIDVFIDAHSHETIVGDIYKNRDGEDVLLSSTGSKFQNFGVLTLESGDVVSTGLIETTTVNVESSAAVTAEYNRIKAIVDGYNEELEYLYEELGTSDVTLSVYDADGEYRIRNREMNLGNFVADAYREVSGADIAFANGGGIRADIAKGAVTRKTLMDINPWNNSMCVIKVTGQQVIDALEHGARLYPETCGGFLQVSGITYKINSEVESPVVTDEMGMFIEIDESKERRVYDVKVADIAIDPDKEYTLAATEYMLVSGGDGYTMFAGADRLDVTLPTDAEMLIKYFSENLSGNITEEQYGSVEGRIVIGSRDVDAGVNHTWIVILCSAGLMAAFGGMAVNVKRRICNTND